MKNHCLFLIAFLLFGMSYKPSKAIIGDTTFVTTHNAMPMTWYGYYNDWGVFPSQGISYSKAILDLKLNCPSSGCSAWDYTVTVYAQYHTGKWDSTLTPAPLYTIGSSYPDSIYLNFNTTYVTFYDTLTQSTDSIPATTFQVNIHSDSLNPFLTTDSMSVYPANYYNYIFNSSGVIIDSLFVGADSLLVNSVQQIWVPFEVIEPIELARVITPYGGYYSTAWNNSWHYDVTDYTKILHDSVEIRVLYSGYSSGFGITLKFAFIEGIPPRNVKEIRNIYDGSFPFGNANNSIENYLTPETFALDTSEQMALVRVTPTGHGYDANECAEFCQKSYQLIVNNNQVANVNIWRSDCGMNALYHQAGTWLYDRANWCPGEKGLRKDHEITSYITPGSNATIEMNMTPYTINPPSAVYTISAQLITYGGINFTTDASIEEIIAPNKDFNYNRFNPICNHPAVVIKNTGADTLTSALITYGLEGGTMSTFNWTGSLLFNQREEVILGNMTWGGTSSDVFKVFISNPNGGTDNYNYNDTLRSEVSFTPVYLPVFYLFFRTNSAPAETIWDLQDDNGNILYSNGALAANTTYRDTFNLSPGCYTLTIYDSDKDGLSFFANNDGTGAARLYKTSGPPIPFKTFESDFGTQISQRFTVGYATGINDFTNEQFESSFKIFPNPSSGMFSIDLSLPEVSEVKLEIYSVLGSNVYSKSFTHFQADIFDVDLENASRGIYYVKVSSSQYVATKKVVIE